MASYPRSIATMYRGTRFRSRLEAQWARWLDGHAIAWAYEPESWSFGGLCYCPDFWLAEQKVVLEVKGVLDRISEAKLIGLAKVAAQEGVLVLVGGAPGQDWRPVAPTPRLHKATVTSLEGPQQPSACELLRCSTCQRWVFTDVWAQLPSFGWACRLCGTRHGSADGLAHPHLGGRFQAMTCQQCLHLPPLRPESGE